MQPIGHDFDAHALDLDGLNIDFASLPFDEIEAFLLGGSRGIPEYAASCHLPIDSGSSCSMPNLDLLLDD